MENDTTPITISLKLHLKLLTNPARIGFIAVKTKYKYRGICFNNIIVLKNYQKIFIGERELKYDHL